MPTPLTELLDELEDYFDNKADAEIVDGTTHANKEMRLLAEVRAQIAVLPPEPPVYANDGKHNCPHCGLPDNTTRCTHIGCPVGADL